MLLRDSSDRGTSCEIVTSFPSSSVYVLTRVWVHLLTYVMTLAYWRPQLSLREVGGEEEDSASRWSVGGEPVTVNWFGPTTWMTGVLLLEDVDCCSAVVVCVTRLSMSGTSSLESGKGAGAENADSESGAPVGSSRLVSPPALEGAVNLDEALDSLGNMIVVSSTVVIAGSVAGSDVEGPPLRPYKPPKRCRGSIAASQSPDREGFSGLGGGDDTDVGPLIDSGLVTETGCSTASSFVTTSGFVGGEGFRDFTSTFLAVTSMCSVSSLRISVHLDSVTFTAVSGGDAGDASGAGLDEALEEDSVVSATVAGSVTTGTGAGILVDVEEVGFEADDFFPPKNEGQNPRFVVGMEEGSDVVSDCTEVLAALTIIVVVTLTVVVPAVWCASVTTTFAGDPGRCESGLKSNSHSKSSATKRPVRSVYP